MMQPKRKPVLHIQAFFFRIVAIQRETKNQKNAPTHLRGFDIFQVAAQAVGLNSVAIRKCFKIRMQGNSGYILKEPFNLRMTGRPEETQL